MLTLFPNFLKLFIFLYQLADHLYNQTLEMSDEVSKDEAGFEERFRNAVQNLWRPCEHSLSLESQWEDETDDSIGEGMNEGPDDDDDDDEDQEIHHLPYQMLCQESSNVSKGYSKLGQPVHQ
ncbi:hypothetical protein AGABI1DRAFT_131252 [Agaricus bisporus var. burnettii JB137-S8]|uniref:Uncharacterized protein n=1 Tax=Agaricus bisporus var. burnettii (strain JB137-S8 / ATCC MYA-4627 / FGSC 10392) TaxID=597362 RepID=K5VPM4_AGABU|nr:uncharacterized protein AGABI1DRAFT_131252 [Agaricus bisporus var. burnettii JB137-S8]EKM76424.1 hypothetical protein AGABI1DRAFT_131252 [Agaricus bisporus var. burnettii JB137-S8]